MASIFTCSAAFTIHHNTVILSFLSYTHALSVDRSLLLGKRLQAAHDALGVLGGGRRVVNRVHGNRNTAILNHVSLAGQRAVAVDTGVDTSSIGLNVGPGEDTLLRVPDGLINVGVASHTCAHNLGLGAVAFELGNVNVEAVAERQQRATLGAGLDDLLNNLDSRLGNERGRVAAVLDVVVGNLLVAARQSNGRDTAVRGGIGGACCARQGPDKRSQVGTVIRAGDNKVRYLEIGEAREHVIKGDECARGGRAVVVPNVAVMGVRTNLNLLVLCDGRVWQRVAYRRGTLGDQVVLRRLSEVALAAKVAFATHAALLGSRRNNPGCKRLAITMSWRPCSSWTNHCVQPP